MTAPAIRLDGITKRFPGVIANDDVHVEVQSGTVHAIVGENGAGKSTLMKILYGMHRPDEGTIEIDGVAQTFRNPKDAIAAGIGMVHQHFMLADQLTVLENIVLGAEPRRGFRLDHRAARDRINDLGERYGMDVDPDVLLEELEVGQRQRVEIIKVLFRGARILVLDEPTAVLVPQEVDELFTSIRELTAQGQTVIFISHKLDEVLEIADRITVIRRGRTVDTVDPSDVTSRQLAELMVGSELPTPSIADVTGFDEVVLELDDVTVAQGGRPTLDGVSLQIRRGEIVGVAGVEGNGQTDLVEAIIGLAELGEGWVRLLGDDLSTLGTRQRRERGIGYIPEDRHRRGLLLDASLWQNAILGHQSEPPIARGPWLDLRAARKRTQDIIDGYDVRTPGITTTAHALSGGNQQKFIIGREMEAKPSLLIAAHPTRGIDVGAQAVVWELMREARHTGMATLLISADLDELIGLSDRLLVMLRGQIVAELDPRDITPQILGSHMTGASTQDQR